MTGNSKKTGKRAPTPSSWKPGQSGNKNGRPKLSLEQKEARLQAQAVIDAHTVDAAHVLVEQLTDEDKKLRQSAAFSILDRASIKGVDRLETVNKGDGVPSELANLSDEELRQVRDTLARARARTGAPKAAVIQLQKAVKAK